jgi:hypothetical protein
VFFVITFVSAIAGLHLYDPVLNDADYIVGDGADTRVRVRAFCEVILIIANIGTALALFPILRLQGVAKSSTSTPEWSRAPGAPRWLRRKRHRGSGAA